MKIKYFALFALIILGSVTINGQYVPDKKSLVGSWLGKLSTNGIDLRFVFNLKIVGKDSLAATADSPDQGARNIPLGRVILNGNKLVIKAPLLTGEYNATVTGDSTMEGTWTQRGGNYPLNLKKLAKTFSINRPQEPKPPFPYTSEDVTFENNKFKIKLAGTLTMPEGPGPFKAAILITGSGAQNRNEELLGHKPFLVIADYLTRNGIAVLRYDDRGVGGSQGNYSEATTADLATDAQAAFEFLRKNPKINSKEIGLIGHSEGGLIAPIVASGNHEIGFIVSLAGPGVTGEQIILKQSQDISRISGLNESTIKESTEINKKLYSILKKEKDNKTAETKILAAYKEFLIRDKKSTDEIDKSVNQLKMTFGANLYTWFRFFIITDPAKYWKQVKCPVLALDGENDLQVSAKVNLPAIAKALKAGGNKSVITYELPGLNHLFQHCTTGLPSEYSSIEETFSPDVLKIISDWILKL